MTDQIESMNYAWIQLSNAYDGSDPLDGKQFITFQ